jgi:uncharacterized protein (TIGR00725 family)
VIGDGSLEETGAKAALAFDLGEQLVDGGYRVVSGGLGGVMRAVCRGAHASDAYYEGCTVGILPGDEHGDAASEVDVVVPTGFGHGRNMLVAQSDAVVAIGGRAGTLSEMAFAWIARRMVLAYEVDGWSGRMAGECIDDRNRLPKIGDDRVFGVGTAVEVVDRLDARLDDYREARR